MKYGIIAVVAISVLAGGCQRKAEGQTVAVVNGEEITAPDLNFALGLSKLPADYDKNKARSQVLQQLVDRRLLAEQARKEGIDKSPEYLNRERRADEDLLISMLADRRLNTAQLPSDREIQNFISTHPEMFANREQWDLDQVKYQTPSDPAIKAEVLAANSLDAMAAVLQKHNIAMQRQKNRLDTAVVPIELYSKLNSLPTGKPFAVNVGNTTVVSTIVGREPHPITGDQAKPVAVQVMRKTQTAKALQQMLKSLRSSAKIDYQSGYAPAKS